MKWVFLFIRWLYVLSSVLKIFIIQLTFLCSCLLHIFNVFEVFVYFSLYTTILYLITNGEVKVDRIHQLTFLPNLLNDVTPSLQDMDLTFQPM